MNIKKYMLLLALPLGLCVVTPAYSSVITGSQSAIHEITGGLDGDIDTTGLASDGEVDTLSAGANRIIQTVNIDNNYEEGFKVTMASTNSLLLKRATTHSDASAYGATVVTEIAYTLGLMENESNTGTLGTGTAPADFTSAHPLTVAVPTMTRAQTTATVGYDLDVIVNVAATPSLLQGNYTDTLTLTWALCDEPG